MQHTRKKNFCILVALPEEFNTVVDVYADLLEPAAKGAAERFGVIKRPEKEISGSLVIRHCKSMQNTWAAAATAAMLTDYEPDVLVFIGIAAAMQPKHVRLGDVIVADSLRSRCFQKICDKSEVKDDPAYSVYDGKYALRALTPSLPDIAPRTLQLVQKGVKTIGNSLSSPKIETEILNGVQGSSKAAARDCEVSNEQIFSWDLVLDSRAYRDSLVKSESKAYALDMESLGFYSVVEECAKLGKIVTDAIVFRGISDYAAFKAPSGTAKIDWRKVATENAAKAAREFLETADFVTVGSIKV